MSAPRPSSIHKNLIFISAGCLGVLVVFMVIAMLTVQHLGFEAPPPPQYVTPPQSRAALDSLSRVDVSRWLEYAEAPGALRCRTPDASQRVAPRAAADTLSPPVAFGDTFAAGSLARRNWESLAGGVDIVPALGAATPPESLPQGRHLLAALRVSLNDGSRARACLLLSAVVDEAGWLDADQRLDRVVSGAWMLRDAADMVSRDRVLQQLAGLAPSRAAELLGAFDARKRRLVGLRELIDAAGTSPLSCDSLAAWARDEQLPLAVRDAYVRAIGYDWVFDAPEVTFLSPARLATLNQLLDAGLPQTLRKTARDAVAVLQRNLAQRFQFAVTYRMTRQMQQ